MIETSVGSGAAGRVGWCFPDHLLHRTYFAQQSIQVSRLCEVQGSFANALRLCSSTNIRRSAQREVFIALR